MPIGRPYRAGDSIEDYCRACKTDRIHTVMAADGGQPVRIVCDYCRSEHNYRGGPRIGEPGAAPARSVSEPAARRAAPPPAARNAFPIVSDRERTGPPMTPDASA